MHFTKMHGCGNDYIYVNCFEEQVNDPSAVSVRLSDRRKGVGSDGLVLILPSDTADFRMRIFNADGSEAPMCGNASRCVGRYLFERGLTDKKKIALETNSGIKTLDLKVENGTVVSVSVDIGKADFTPASVPVITDKTFVIGEKADNVPLPNGSVICGATRTCLSVGTAHAVYFLPSETDVRSLRLDVIGPQSENAPCYPNRVNTEYAAITDKGIVMRVWERGSGETMACGTGASATAAAAVRLGLCEKNTDIPVIMDGGTLSIRIDASYGVTMTGPAEFVFDGDVAI